MVKENQVREHFSHLVLCKSSEPNGAHRSADLAGVTVTALSIISERSKLLGELLRAGREQVSLAPTRRSIWGT